MASKCGKCALCNQWFLSDDEVVLNDEKTYHRECLGGGGVSSDPVKSSDLSFVKSPEKMSLEGDLSAHATIAYKVEISLDRIHGRIRWPPIITYKHNLKSVIMPALIEG